MDGPFDLRHSCVQIYRTPQILGAHVKVKTPTEKKTIRTYETKVWLPNIQHSSIPVYLIRFVNGTVVFTRCRNRKSCAKSINSSLGTAWYCCLVALYILYRFPRDVVSYLFFFCFFVFVRLKPAIVPANKYESYICFAQNEIGLIMSLGVAPKSTVKSSV